MKIGILGGSFNPIHVGHIYLAKQAYISAGLDEVWLMPSFITPFKEDKKMATSFDRFQMCTLAASEYEYIKVSDFEMKREEISYTYLTLESLKKQYKEDSFYFIMGGDSLESFKNWKHPEIICSLCTLLVMNRNGLMDLYIQDKVQELKDNYDACVQIIDCEEIEVSSTEIRHRIRTQKDCTDLLSKPVYDYIKRQDLYTE